MVIDVEQGLSLVKMTIRVFDDAKTDSLTADDARTYRRRIREGTYASPLVIDALARLLRDSGDI